MCTENFAKVALIAFNVVFLIAGLALLAVGTFVRLMKTEYDELFGASALITVTYIMIGAGALVVLVSLAGCVGAFTKSKPVLIVTGLHFFINPPNTFHQSRSKPGGQLDCEVSKYFIFLLIVFVVEAAAGIIGFLNYDKVLPVLKENTEKGIMSRYGYQDYKALSKAIDYMQQELQCCGFNAPADWIASKYYTDVNTAAARGTTVVPRSCCKQINEEDCNESLDPNKVFAKGCVESLVSWAQDNLLLVGGISTGVAMIQLFGMVFSLILYKTSDDEDTSF